jgi:WD40 repeat protein
MFDRLDTDAVTALAFGGQDGRLLVSGSLSRTVRTWDASGIGSSLPELRQLDSHTAQVRSVAFGPDQWTLVSGGDDGTAIVWDVRRPPGSERRTRLRAGTGGINALAFAGGRLLTGGDDGHVHIWVTDVRTALRRACEVAGSPITAAEWVRYFPAGISFRGLCG